ncbi:MAG: molybdopterin-dependent oxidoreductase [Defluviicoccus sp.]|nr:molybdopterin-dependent oxidoreductase [Defluviicoccus sp.]MDE0382569.1 molybdopterin-dependent oxidoreductase [Defluviicoccus sp.]
MAPNPSLVNNPSLDDWLAIGPGETVAVRSGKVDIGQRISTAVAMLMADELGVDPARVETVRTETGLSPDEGITSGSYSMTQTGEAVRRAAATARRHLLERAARLLDVDPATLEVDDGTIHSRATNRQTSYWELAEGEKFGIDVDPDAPLRPREALSHVGTAAVARDLEDIVRGRPHFLQDMSRPGMLHARVVRPPHYHARYLKIDPATLDRLAGEGVRVVRDGSFLAVAAEDEFQAAKAAERLAAAVVWDEGEGLATGDIYESLRSNERVSLPVVDGAPVRAPVPPPGDPPPAAALTYEARYERPYQMHASLGPSAALAELAEGRLTIVSHSQGIYFLRAALAEAFDMEPGAIHIVHAPGAGCYGHNGADDAALDAAIVARALPGTPVLLKWTREEEHAWEPYGTCMSMDLRASLDADGRIVAWSHESFGDTFMMRPRSGPDKIGAARLLSSRFLDPPLDPPVMGPAMGPHIGIHRNLDPLYDLPGKRLVKHLVRGMPLRVSALRSLGAYANVFAIESFMDELAAEAGIDPVELRLSHLSDPRARAVIEAAAERLHPTGTDCPEGCGRGIAFARYKNIAAYAAVVIEVSVTDAAEIRLERCAIAADAGEIVDRAGLAAQLEGGVVQAASWTLHEAVAFDRDGILSRDWETYPILGFDNVPEFETVLVDPGREPFLGAGEATAGPTAAAIANAVHAATGLRLRRVPFTPDAVRAAALA